MLEKLKSYFRFWNKKPSYHVESSPYGGFRMDIDKYYSLEENKNELDELNKTFGEILNKENKEVEEKKSSSITS